MVASPQVGFWFLIFYVLTKIESCCEYRMHRAFILHRWLTDTHTHKHSAADRSHHAVHEGHIATYGKPCTIYYELGMRINLIKYSEYFWRTTLLTNTASGTIRNAFHGVLCLLGEQSILFLIGNIGDINFTTISVLLSSSGVPTLFCLACRQWYQWVWCGFEWGRHSNSSRMQ